MRRIYGALADTKIFQKATANQRPDANKTFCNLKDCEKYPAEAQFETILAQFVQQDHAIDGWECCTE
eukprot:4446646-Karenia_brevis.AAC.1